MLRSSSLLDDSLQRGVVSVNADDQYVVTSEHERYYRTVVVAYGGGGV